ncbi:MAG: glycine--tRNA ligase subunit beta [Candidatus Cloacimonetes bacterium]|nr:glycine--tRNA ligase subunit beta [Candidatus Cloacimonadota bacterium]
MEKHTFLFELGVEEIPAGYIKPALVKLTSFVELKLQENDLSYESIDSYSTPRRFALLIQGLQGLQQDKIIEKIGPAERVAILEDGTLSKAGQGFLKGAGADAKSIFIKETPKGNYIAVKIEMKGKSAEELLLEIIPQAVGQMNFPKAMRWGANEMSFARPVRWVVSMLDEKVIPVQIEHLNSDCFTYGNRFVDVSYKLLIPEASMYLSVTSAGFVLADREHRKQRIITKTEEILSGTNLEMIPDERLLDTVCDLVEYPTPVLAEFPEKYLQLPDKIITSTISQNQKYFSLRDSQGDLSNKFIFVSNGNPNYSEIIREGNEKVVTPRLVDAEFYYLEDTRHPLSHYTKKLEEVTFQAKLGNLKEKTERVTAIAAYISETLGLSSETQEQVLRTAQLAKADLVTLMLGEKEFTKLQGYIGMKYALATGENPEVAKGIYEHYMPRGQNDSLPESLTGAIVAVADKIDTVCGIIGVDLIPTGSTDPFALRRAANGIVQIVDAWHWTIDINKLIAITFEKLASKLSEPYHNMEFVLTFFKQRIDWLLQQDNIEYDVIESVLHLDYSNISDLKQRAADLQSFKKNESFIKLVLGFKRVSNIIANETETYPINEILLTDEAEISLFEEYKTLKPVIEKELKDKNYHRIMNSLVDFGTHIDFFFDKVLVNTDEVDIRNNRYALLQLIRNLFLNVSDLNKIVVEGNE